ncbi:MAG: hypothetical protein Q9221_006356 [Calogaya cf. arnoldii]
MDEVPATDCAPLSPSGSFSINAMEGKYICERKFSVSWISLAGTNHPGTDGPSLMVVLSPLSPYGNRGTTKPSYSFQMPRSVIPGVYWVPNNLFWLIHKWEEVLDALDTQTTLSSSVTFDSDARQGILFEDRNFSNSKRYFWALQSLRIFAEYIDSTLRIIPFVINSAKHFDGSPKDSTEHHETRKRFIMECQEKFGVLRDRIERKRQEVQSLSDGVSEYETNTNMSITLFSASSVAEGRLATEQNGNIRLLTMVTIAFLPLNLATSIYGMDALPNSANLVSYVVVTILLCAITYILVLNLPYLKNAMSSARDSVYRSLRIRKKKDVKVHAERHKRINSVAYKVGTMA